MTDGGRGRAVTRRRWAAAVAGGAVAGWAGVAWWSSGGGLRERMRLFGPEVTGNMPVAFSPGGELLLTRQLLPDQGLEFWDTRTGRRLGVWLGSGAPSNYSLDAAFSPDGRTLAVAASRPNFASYLVFVDVATVRERRRVNFDQAGWYALNYTPDGSALRVRLFGYAPGEASEVRELDPETGAERSRRVLNLNGPGPRSADPAGALVASVGMSGPDRFRVTLTDTATGEVRSTVPGDAGAGAISCLAFSDDGRTLAVGRVTGRVELWDVATLRRTRVLGPVSDGLQPNQVAISPDGRRVAVSAFPPPGGPAPSAMRRLRRAYHYATTWGTYQDFNEVSVWDATTGRRLARVEQESAPMFSPDGRQLVTFRYHTRPPHGAVLYDTP